MTRIAGAVACVVVVLVLIIALRQATMSVHHPAPDGSTTSVVVSAATKNRRVTASVAAMTRAQVAMCRLEVHDETTDPELVALSDDTFGFRLRPALDESDRRQLHGCLEDALIDHIQLKVERIESHQPS